jgi:LuxR family transcriptional regulator, quorum-sensing system regulator CviR
MDTAVPPFPAHIFEESSKSDLKNFLEVMHYAVLAETTQDVKDVLIRTKKFLPFDRLIGGLVRLDADGSFDGFSDVLNVNFPQIWLFHYWRNGYGKVDPVLHALVRSQEAQLWNQVYAGVTSDKEKEFVESATSFGLGDGITVGTLDPSCGVTSFFAFGGGEPAQHERYVRFVDYLGQHLHLALMRSSSKAACVTSKCVNKLSPKEVTILNWMKDGKTNWEIAKITGVTERTIRFHVESIFSKLNVTSRTQAVAVAVQHGLPNLA